MSSVPPRPPGLDQLGLIQAVDGLSQGIVMRITDDTNRRIDAFLETRGMLVLADRGYYSLSLWREAAATGADLLWRVKGNLPLPAAGVSPAATPAWAESRGGCPPASPVLGTWLTPFTGLTPGVPRGATQPGQVRLADSPDPLSDSGEPVISRRG
jgi:hypothetical protein